MERQYPYKMALRLDDLATMVESQLEFLIENEFGDIENVINSFSKEEYKRLIEDTTNDLDSSEIWYEVDQEITRLLNENIKTKLDKGE